jgi:hypothetical protein
MYIVKGVYMSLSTSLQLGGKSPISGSPIYTLRNSPGPPLKKNRGMTGYSMGQNSRPQTCMFLVFCFVTTKDTKGIGQLVGGLNPSETYESQLG